MFTIFSIPKPFQGHINIIQRNAIKSWLLIDKKIEIILYGDELGIKEIADEFKIKNIPNVKKNEFGTPLLNYIFGDVKKRSNYDIIIYVNTDIIFNRSFKKVMNLIKRELFNKEFLIGGRRIDCDISQQYDFTVDKDVISFQKIVKETSKPHRYSGIDYFIFKKTIPISLKQFAVGRPGWDNWFIYQCLVNNILVFDATKLITAVHQNHSNSYHINDKESQKNLKYIKKRTDMATLYNAKFLLTDQGIIRPNIFRRLITKLTFIKFIAFIIFIKRQIINKFTR